LSMSHSIAGSTRPVAFADSLRQICGSRCARRLRVLLDYPPQPITERNQITPLGQPKRYLASLLGDSGEGIRLVVSTILTWRITARERTNRQMVALRDSRPRNGDCGATPIPPERRPDRAVRHVTQDGQTKKLGLGGQQGGRGQQHPQNNPSR